MVSRNTPAKQDETSGEVALSATQELPLSVVQDFRSIADIENFFNQQGIVLSAGEEISDGFETLEDKDRLLSTTLCVIDWKRLDSKEFGSAFYSIRVMTLAGEKYRISDGSTGIARQLENITAVRLGQNHSAPNAGLIVKGGLSKSTYWVSEADGKAMSDEEAEKTPKELKKKATTYYLVF